MKVTVQHSAPPPVESYTLVLSPDEAAMLHLVSRFTERIPALVEKELNKGDWQLTPSSWVKHLGSSAVSRTAEFLRKLNTELRTAGVK